VALQGIGATMEAGQSASANHNRVENQEAEPGTEDHGSSSPWIKKFVRSPPQLKKAGHGGTYLSSQLWWEV
jgi:hypothetical protein